MPLKLTKTTAKATTSKELKKSGETVTEDQNEETVPVEIEGKVDEFQPAQLCEVGVDLSYTHNLGNYQSVRVGVSIKIPCKHEEIDSVYTFGKNWADERLNQMVSEVAN